MDSLNNDINSLLYYYVKRDDVGLIHAANNDGTGDAAPEIKPNKEIKNKTKQSSQRINRQVSYSLTSTATHQRQVQSPLTTVTASHFRDHSTNAKSNSNTVPILSAYNSVSIANMRMQDLRPLSYRKYSNMSVPKTKTRKHVSQLIKNLFLGKRRCGRHKSVSYKTSVGHMNLNGEVPLNAMANKELLDRENTHHLQPITNKNMYTKNRKHIINFFKSLVKKKWRQNRSKDVFNETAVETGRLAPKLNDSLSIEYILENLSDEISFEEELPYEGNLGAIELCNEFSTDFYLECIEPMKNRNEGSALQSTIKKHIPHFLRNILKRKQRGASKRTTTGSSAYLGNPRMETLSINNNNDEVLVQQSIIKGCTAIDTNTDLIEQAEPVNVVADLEMNTSRKVSKCECETRRFNLLVDSLNLIIFKKNQTLKEEKIIELQQIDPITCHFKSCAVAALTAKRIESPSNHIGCQNQTKASQYGTHLCLLCQEPDEQFDKDVADNLLPLMTQIENEDDLNIPTKTIEYFLHACCYDHFKEGILKVIGSECTPKNVARLHYLIRRVVKHVGDPNDENNEAIQNILNHAKRFNLHFYQPHIKSTYQSLTNFLLSGIENDEVG